MVLLCAFLLAGTGSHPRGQLRCRWERTGLRAHLRDDLLRRIHSQTRYFCQSDHGIWMGLHGLRDQAVELGHLLIDQLQSLELQGQHLPMHRLHSSRQSIDQLLLRALQPLIS